MLKLLAVAPLATIAAEVLPGNGGDLTTLFQYGVLGVVAVLFLTGRIVPGRQLEKREDEIAKLQAELEERSKVAEERMIPALVEATRVLAAYLDQEARRNGGGQRR